MGLEDIIEGEDDEEEEKPSFLSGTETSEPEEQAEDWNEEPVAWEEIDASIPSEEISISGAGWYIILDSFDENNLTYFLNSLEKKEIASLINLYDKELHSDSPFGHMESEELKRDIKEKKRLLITEYESKEEE